MPRPALTPDSARPGAVVTDGERGYFLDDVKEEGGKLLLRFSDLSDELDDPPGDWVPLEALELQLVREAPGPPAYPPDG